MKNKKNILCGAFAVLALSLAGGSLAFNANADETAGTSGAGNFNNIQIVMKEGASMRIGSAEEGNTETSTGLRFTMQVSAADYAVLSEMQYESIEWGMLIAPVDYVEKAQLSQKNVFEEKNAVYVLNKALTAEQLADGKLAAINVTTPELTLASETSLNGIIENPESTYIFSGYVHTIKDYNLTRGFVGCGYLKYTVAGETNYIIPDVDLNNARSAYYVAQKYVDDSKVTNQDAKDYVQTHYLDNATALETAEVEVAAQDYMEDITIGTYAAKPEDNTVKLKIGEAYDAANEEMNKKDGYKLVSTSGKAAPLYRGQKLSIKRYYESNDYIPFSNTESAVSVATAEDGEEVAGAYKYTTKQKNDTGLKFAYYDTKNNVVKDKVIRGKAASESGKYLVGYVNMQFRWETASAGGFNLVSQLGDFNNSYNSDWCVSSNWFNAKGTSLGGVSFYKVSGYSVNRVEAGTWYKVAFPVYTNYHDPARFGSMFLQIDAKTGSGNNEVYSEQTVYFKEVTISEKDIYADQVPETPDPEAYKPTIGSSGSCELVTEGDFKNTYKYTINESGSEASALVFGDTSSPVYKAKYVTMEICFENVSVIWTRDQLGYVNNTNNYFDWRKLGTAYALDDDTRPVKFYAMDGTAVTTIQNNTWYKVAIPVKAVANKDYGRLIMAIEFDKSSTSAAAVYVRNADYGSTNIYAK